MCAPKRPTNYQPIKFRFPSLRFKGSDVFLVAKEAAMRPLRRLMAQLEAVASKGDEQPHHGRRGGSAAVQQPATTVPEVGADVVRGVRACTESGWGGLCQQLGICYWRWLVNMLATYCRLSFSRLLQIRSADAGTCNGRRMHRQSRPCLGTVNKHLPFHRHLIFTTAGGRHRGAGYGRCASCHQGICAPV